MKYIVVSQDREVFKVFKEALGTEPMKISSILAAMTVLGDKDSAFDFVVIDNDLKGIDNLLKLLKKRKITFYIIGDTFEKPITVEHIKAVLYGEQESGISEPLFSNSDNEDKPPVIEAEKIQIRVREERNFIKDDIEPVVDKNNDKPILRKKKIAFKPTLALENEVKDEDEDIKNKKEGFNITNIFGKGIKSVLSSKEASEGIFSIQKFKKTKTRVISQQVIGIRRVKGGVGATSIALHLAQAFNSQDIKTCIIDVNFADGGSDLSYYLNLTKIPHWGNFLRNTENKTSFQDSLIDYKSISIMQVPPAMSLIEDYLTPEAVIKAMNYARKQFTMVIIDLPNEINPLIREVLDSFLTTTILVTSGHISELNRLEKLNDLDNPILVLNGQGAKNLDKFKDYLDGIDDFVTIPEDTEIYRTLEKNKLRSINTPYGMGINNLANKIFEI